ncbi:hypothetical protein B0H21DRAFT_752569 [Amylocystis lapponica]|nr:hypothetical protein B0H21DRAFT_752569 [Amylocystis lapponica]
MTVARPVHLHAEWEEEEQKPEYSADDISNIVTGYIQNEVPTRLIYIPEMKLMSRGEIRKIAQPAIAIAVASDPEVNADYLLTRELAYAILSHRWLAEGEPTYNDMTASRDHPGNEVGEGHKKLRKFCEVAAAHGCDWAWSDTCCIDKSSSSELDEAIRSMYRWYAKEKVCIVHLADTISREELASDMWFTRGDWMPLTAAYNDRQNDTFLSSIARITDIPIHDLREFSPGTNRIRETMSWASPRKTTRVEDEAYSLIGLFDISLIPAYGEGQRAFYRLQMAIMERSDSLELLTWDRFHYRSSGEHILIASSPRCFGHPKKPWQVYQHRPVWVHDVRPWAGSASTSIEWVQIDLDTAICQSGPFAMTNAGLRIELDIYDLSRYFESSPESDTPAKWTPASLRTLSQKPGEFWTHGIRWWSSYGGTEEWFFPDNLPPISNQSPARFSVGVINFDWNDANGVPDSSERILACRPLAISESLPEGEVPNLISGIPILVGQRRRERVYLTIFLQKAGSVGSKRRLTAVQSGGFGRLHRIMRPESGWKPSETVYIVAE